MMGYGEIYLHRQNETLLTRTKNFGRTFMKFPPFPPSIVSMVADYEVTMKKQVEIYTPNQKKSAINSMNFVSLIEDSHEKRIFAL